jgi:IS30 family transposase
VDYTHLTFAQRYHIALGLKQGLTVTVIARRVGIHRSTVYRELARGGDRDGSYYAPWADDRALARARSSAANHPTKSPELWRWVARCLRQRASPDQVAGRLGQVCPSVSVSVPAIYAFVRRDERAGGQLYSCLRYAHKRFLWRRGTSGGLPSERPSIKQRPKLVWRRRQSGHWEADTMLGNKTHPARVLTAVERTSRYTRLALLADGTADRTGVALQRVLAAHQVRSITFDNGVEFANYKQACSALDAKPYFAQPSRPWQRGTCENTIGLIRQYLPKYKSLAKLTRKHLLLIQNELNHRPRRCLGYLTPHEVLYGLRPTPVALRT